MQKMTFEPMKVDKVMTRAEIIEIYNTQAICRNPRKNVPHCPKCNDKEWIIKIEPNGHEYMTNCECYVTRTTVEERPYGKGPGPEVMKYWG